MKKNNFLKGLILSCYLVADLNAEVVRRNEGGMIEVEPYKSINALPLDLHGWFSDENKKYLQRFIQAKQPKVIVELGSWLGASAIFMASLLQGDSKIYAVDHWLGNEASRNNPDLQDRILVLYRQFLSNVKHSRLTHRIIPIRMSSLEAVEALNVKPDPIYVDAAHDEESVFQDIIHWHPKLNIGGIMCGDDWSSDSVRRGVVRALSHLGIPHKTLHSEGNFWYLD